MITINRAFAIIRHYGKSFLCINTAKNDAEYLFYLSTYFYKTSINIIDVIYLFLLLNGIQKCYSKFIVILIIYYFNCYFNGIISII